MSFVIRRDDSGIELERRGLRDRVYDLILGILTTTDAAPGSRLSIDHLAEDLGVSPTPVREALAQIERTGLVTREPRKGYRIAPPLSDSRLEALFDARLIIEGGATELAARHPETLIPRLEEALTTQRMLDKRIELSLESGERPLGGLWDYFRGDWNFHRVIFESISNPFLLDMSEVISSRVHRMRQVARDAGTPDGKNAIAEHQKVFDAFVNEPAGAAAAMREHIEHVRERARRDALVTKSISKSRPRERAAGNP